MSLAARRAGKIAARIPTTKTATTTVNSLQSSATLQITGGTFTVADVAANTAIGRLVVNGTAEQVEELVVAANEARTSGRLGAGERLVVVVDDADESGWEVIGSGAGWQASDTPVTAATAFLQAR